MAKASSVVQPFGASRFTTQEAIRAGITARHLRSQRWRAPFRGVHEAAGSPATLLSQCRALARVLPPEAVFSGITAARLRGWWLPRRAELLPLQVSVPVSTVIDRPGVRAARRSLQEHEVSAFHDLLVTTGPRTLRDLAVDWSLIDLVVMADAALRLGDCSAAEWLGLADLRGGRGIRTLRRAIPLADARSESAMETLMRLMIVVPGLPTPTPQATLRDREGGWLARVDLLGANGVSVLEFNGADHEELNRREYDARRWRMLNRHGFGVYPYTARDIFLGATQVISDYQTAHGLLFDAGAVDAWMREFRLSSFGRR